MERSRCTADTQPNNYCRVFPFWISELDFAKAAWEAPTCSSHFTLHLQNFRKKIQPVYALRERTFCAYFVLHAVAYMCDSAAKGALGYGFSFFLAWFPLRILEFLATNWWSFNGFVGWIQVFRIFATEITLSTLYSSD